MSAADWQQRVDFYKTEVAAKERALNDARATYQRRYFAATREGDEGARELAELRQVREDAERELSEARDVLAAAEIELRNAQAAEADEVAATEWAEFEASAADWSGDAHKLQSLAEQAGELLARLAAKGQALRLKLPHAAKNLDSAHLGSIFYSQRCVGEFGRLLFVASGGVFEPRTVAIPGSAHEVGLRPRLAQVVDQAIDDVRRCKPANLSTSAVPTAEPTSKKRRSASR